MTIALEDAQYDAYPNHDTHETTVGIPMRDGHLNQLRIITPGTDSPSGLPLMVFIHGGAFFAGTNKQTVPWARAISSLYKVIVVLPAYRLAPEYKFPISSSDTWDTVQWISKNASSLSADLSAGFVLAGLSAGGNLATVAAQKALEANLSPGLTGVLASVPYCLSEEIVPQEYKDLWFSRDQNANAPILGSSEMNMMTRQWEPNPLSTDFSPFNSKVRFVGLPKTYVQVCGLDSLRDDGLIYARALRKDGVDVKLDVYPGMMHGHFNVVPEHTLSVKANIDLICAAGWLLGREVDREVVEHLWGKTA